MSTCSIVLCDDSRDFVTLLKLLLDLDPGFEVIGEAHDGAAAIELCTRLQPDLLLLDVSMPVMDGITALPQVLKASPDTTVVMLSGFSSDDVKRQAAELGACRFLEKGISPTELPAQLKEVCGKSG